MTLTDTAPHPGTPTLSSAELTETARRFAAAAERWAARSVAPAGRRRFGLLHLADDVEVWAIGWPTEGCVELHDHGGSAGSLFVVRGELHESFVTDRGGLGRRRIPTSSGASFGPGHIHDVTNLGPAALSVHAYSPPMPKMTFYRLGAGGPVPERIELRTDPSWTP